MTLDDRFWSKVVKTETCWLWLGARHSAGYGQFSVGGRLFTTHRLAYEDACGPIPSGLEIDHKCHVRHCVRPDHLQAVTPQQNQENRAGIQRNNRSGFRGVDQFRNKWRATARVAGKQHYAGLFSTVEAAAAAASALRTALMTNSLTDRRE